MRLSLLFTALASLRGSKVTILPGGSIVLKSGESLPCNSLLSAVQEAANSGKTKSEVEAELAAAIASVFTPPSSPPLPPSSPPLPPPTPPSNPVPLTVRAKLWGAGGGSGYANYYVEALGGGAGGFTVATMLLPRGSTLIIVVGEGGFYDQTYGAYGGGGELGYSLNHCGSGGGMSGIFLNSVTQENAILIAGGGGGGGTNSENSENSNGQGRGGAGGGGGGEQGQDGQDSTQNSVTGGGGGGQNGGGSAGSSGPRSSLRTSGSALKGGTGDGGTGGGGYYGGGGAGSDYGTGPNGAGGGGGSGYWNPLYVSDAQLMLGNGHVLYGADGIEFEGQTSGHGGKRADGQERGGNGLVILEVSGETLRFEYTGSDQTYMLP